MTLKEILQRASQEHWAAGHFNASEFDQMRAVTEACRQVGSPAIIGFSEGERKHLGLNEAVALREVLVKEYNLPVFLNADHTRSVELAKQAVAAGFDSVHIDLSAKNFEENVNGTKEIVAYAQSINPNISVEGELGYLRGESKVQKEKIAVNPEDYTKPEEAKKFVELTGVDRLAVAVGNIHGISLDEPDLDIERIKQIKSAMTKETILVLHAASGISDEQIKSAIAAGIANIHINTDLRVAFMEGLKREMEAHEEEVAMYKLDQPALNSMKEIVVEKLTLFGAVGKIMA